MIPTNRDINHITAKLMMYRTCSVKNLLIYIGVALLMLLLLAMSVVYGSAYWQAKQITQAFNRGDIAAVQKIVPPSFIHALEKPKVLPVWQGAGSVYFQQVYPILNDDIEPYAYFMVYMMALVGDTPSTSITRHYLTFPNVFEVEYRRQHNVQVVLQLKRQAWLTWKVSRLCSQDVAFNVLVRCSPQ